MKAMKNTMKCLVAVFVMAMVFAVTGITAQAMEATYVPTKRTDLIKDSVAVPRDYSVPAKSAVVVPISIPGKGGLDTAYIAQDSPYTPYEDIYVTIYADAACTMSVSGAYIGYVGSVIEGDTFGFAGATTVYMLVENNADEPLVFRFMADFIDGANRKIKSGGSTAIYQNEYNKPVYTEFKATQTGYIAVTVQAVDSYSVYTKLCNSSKKALSDDQYISNGIVYYGVEKGKKYYIATNTYAELYNIKVKQTKISEKSGSSKSKAQSIKKNKTVKGVQIANKKKSGNDWYKIYLSSNKKVKFTIKGGATNATSYGSDIEMKLIPANKNVRLYGNTFDVINGTATYTSNGTLRAGTYYLQVYKKDKMSSGWYSIKWK